MKVKKKMTKEKSEQIYKQIALKNGVTVEEVKTQIKLAMVVGMCNQSPEVQAKWAEIPHDGNVPTPEELLIYLTTQLSK